MQNTILKQLAIKAKEAKREGKNTVIVFSNQLALQMYKQDAGQLTAEHFNQLVDQESPLFPISIEEIQDLQQENTCEKLFLRRLLLALDEKQVSYMLINREPLF